MIKTFFKYFFWLLTILIMVIIFCFSSQNATESKSTSEGFTKKVLSTCEDFRELPEKKQNEIVLNLQFAVRKSAHFLVYTALGLSLFMAFLLTFDNKLTWLFSLIGCILYAISDELHQSFVSERSCEIRDVLIDTLGAILGIAIVLLIKFIFAKKKAKQ